MSLAVSKLGHAVLGVQDLERSVAFYRDILGLAVVARRVFDGEEWVFLSSGNSHHDLALVESGCGLHHLAFVIDGSLDELAVAQRSLQDAGVPIRAALDFQVSQALFVTDPDGNFVELSVDTPADPWRDDPSLVANVAPLDLSWPTLPPPT